MAVTLIGHNESFLYSGENSRFYIFYWCLRSGKMDRFFPSSKQHESWSRNYKWPPRERDQRQRDSHSPKAATSQSTAPKPQRHSSMSVRSRDRREGSSRSESVCDRGITLRPEDLLLRKDDIFSIYPRSVFPRSNPTSPHSLPIINPSAYLSPTPDQLAYGCRRMALGGSASELHTKATENQAARRSSDGNYSSYATQTSTAVRFLRDVPHKSNRRNVLRVPQDSVDTASESSISSIPGAEAAASTTSADVETLSSSTSSISGRDGDPTTTSSPLSTSSTSPSEATSNDSRFSSSTKCSYCRLVSSGDSTECCCICNHKHSACSCSTVTTPEETQSKLPHEEPLHSTTETTFSSEVQPELENFDQVQSQSLEADRPAIKPKRKLLPPSRVTSFTEVIDNDPEDDFSLSRHTKNLISPGHGSLGQGIKKNAQQSPSFSPVSHLSPSKANEASTSRHFAPDIFYSERSPIKDRHIRKTSYSFAGASPRKKQTEEKKRNDDEEEDSINLRVYSPNAFSYHRLGSSYSRSRCRYASRQDSRRSDDTDNQSTSLEFNALDSSGTASYPLKSETIDHAGSRHHSVPKIKTSRYKRSLSQSELEKNTLSTTSRDTTSCLNTDENLRPTADKDCLNTTNLHIPLSRTRYKHNLLGADTNLGDCVKNETPTIKSPRRETSCKKDSNLAANPVCRIALTKDTSPETSESFTTTNSKSATDIGKQFKHEPGEKKKASKILHTKVTLVKREPLSNRLLKPGANKERNTNADSSSVSEQKDVKNNPPYTYRFGAIIRTAPTRKRTNRQKHSCIHSPTKSIIINVPEVSIETIEVPLENRRSKQPVENKKSSSSISEVQLDIPEPDGLSAEADIDDSTSAIVNIEPPDNTVSDSISSFVQDVIENLDVENLEGQNSASDISESFVSPSHEAKDNTASASSEGIDKDVASGKGEMTTDLDESSRTTTKPKSKVTSDSECSSSYCLCDGTSEQPSQLTEPKSKEEGVLSEEECSLCQKEKRGRALSPDILILNTTEDIPLECPKKQDKTNAIVADSTSLTLSADVTEEEEPSNTSTLTSSTSALKTKTPDFLSADFPFEPEIVHRANPEVDLAEDENCLGNLGSPFRRLSEEEFIATLNIHDAAGKGDLHVVKLLVKKEHKQMETVDERGWTPLHLAAARGHTEIVQYLAQEGAHLAALDPSSYTAIHLASMNGFHHCLEILLQLGVDVDCVTAEGFTPFHLAAMNAHLECCHILLHWGASLEKKDALGRRVQDMIEEYGLDEVAVLICRFKHQLRKFQEVLKKIPTLSSDKGGHSLMASLSQLNESDVPKEILDMLSSLAEENDND